MENVFKKAEDLWEYSENIQQAHSSRIRKHMEMQRMWAAPIRTSETGRTIFVSNEPWTATRLTVSLINHGKLVFRGSMPKDDGTTDRKEIQRQISQVEKMLQAHYFQTDYQMFSRRRGTFRRELAYNMAVYGWHAGINILQDARITGWPIFTDVWSPLDTFPEMEGGTAIIHLSRMRYSQIEKIFGDKRPGGKIKGYNFRPDKESTKPSTMFQVIEYWDDETNAIIVNDADSKGYFIKPQSPHELGHNPAWCNPVDGVPFRTAVTKSNGELLDMPSAESNRWLEFVGQSPMLGYESAYRYMSELANQIADVVERWASPIVLAKTRDGKFVELDLTKGSQNTVPLDMVVEVITPPKFPSDDRAWLAFVQSDMEKASYPRAAYGSVGSTEAAYTLQLLQHASGYIIEPLVQQAEMVYEHSAQSIVNQIERKGKQYIKQVPVRSKALSGAAIYDYITLAELPTNIMIAATIKGAGVPQDKWQALMAVTNAANAMNPVLPIETLIDEYLEREDPPAEVAKIFWEKMTNNQNVIDKAAPITTLIELSDKLRLRATDRGNQLADAFMNMAQVGMQELAQTAAQPPQQPGQGGQPGGPPVPPEMGGEGGPPMQGGLEGDAQMEGASPMGAPPPGIAQPRTGPAPERGALMQQAMAARGMG